MRVLKFGGTSVADGQAIARAGSIVSRQRGATVVVVSALAGVTDALAGLANAAARGEDGIRDLETLTRRHQVMAEAIADAPRRRLLGLAMRGLAESAAGTLRAIRAERCARPPLVDKLLAVGELWSSRLVEALLSDAGVASRWVDARSILQTDGRHQAASPDMLATAKCADRLIRPWLARQRVVVLGGFIGSGPDGATTTLGRGGSDYSATVIGACLSADEIQIWTDVDGVLTADPRVIPHARVVPALSYESAHALARFGAKVLHPRTVEPAASRGIPVRVLNSHRPDAAGTRIGPAIHTGAAHLCAVSSRADITLVEVAIHQAWLHDGVIGRVFREFHDAGVQVVLAELCNGRLALAIDGAADLEPLRRRLSACANVRIARGMSAVCVVGEPVAREPRLVADALALLDDTPIHLMARPAGTPTLGLVLDGADAPGAVRRLHDGFLAGGESHPAAQVVA